MRVSSFVDTRPSLCYPQNKNYIYANSLSPELYTSQPFHFSLSLDAEACLPVFVSTSPVLGLEEKPKGFEATGTEDLVNVCTREASEAGENVSLLKSFRH